MKYHHTNNKQTGDIQKKAPHVRVSGKRIAMSQFELPHLFISEAIAVRADRRFLRVTQAAPFAFTGKFYSYWDTHKK